MTDTTPIFDPTPRYLSADGKWIETTPEGYDIPLLAKGADVLRREAESQGWSIALPGDGHLYLIGPEED